MIQFFGGLEIVAERLLDNDATPSSLLRLGETAAAQLADDRGKESGGDGEVEKPVAVGQMFALHMADLRAEPVESGRVLEVALHVERSFHEPVP